MKIWLLVAAFGKVVAIFGPLPYDMDECFRRAEMVREQVRTVWLDPAKVKELQARPFEGKTLTEADIAVRCLSSPNPPVMGEVVP
jgi:hypothetical protein